MIKNARIVVLNANPDDYHRQEVERGDAQYIVSASMLKIFFFCPDRWVRGYSPPDSDAKDYGTLLDTRLLTPEQFDKRFAIKPAQYKDAKGEMKPWNMNATVCKEWAAEQVKGKREPVSSKEVVEADTAIKRIAADPILCAFVEASDRQVWVIAEWHDPVTKLVIPLKALLDLVPRPDTEFSKSLGDLKSCRSAAIVPFNRATYQMGYHVQGAFHMDCYVAATQEDRNTWCWVLSESYPPFQPGRRFMSQNFLEIGRRKYQAALAFYCLCLKTGKWPDYDGHDEAVQGWTIVEAEPWMESQDQFAPKMQIEGEEPEVEHFADGDVIP